MGMRCCGTISRAVWCLRLWPRRLIRGGSAHAARAAAYSVPAAMAIIG